jgi:hypothetical protein
VLTVQIWNISDLAPVSDYKYAVYINRDMITSGTVTKHTRADGWAMLVAKLAREHLIATGSEMPPILVHENATTANACGKKAPRSNRICVALDTPGHTCKFVKIVPAKRPGVNR